MSGAYEGGFATNVGHSDIKKVWSYDASYQDCPFDDIGVGESVFAMYGIVQGMAVPDPEIIEAAERRQERIDLLAELRNAFDFVDASEPIPSGYVKIMLDDDEGEEIGGYFSTTRESCNQLDKNSCILLNIPLGRLNPGKDLEWGDLTKILSTLDTRHGFRHPFPLEIKKLDQSRMETLYPKADLQEYSKRTERGGNEYFENVHIVLKFSPKSCKTEEDGWITGQRLMGNKLLAEGLMSDFSIKAGGKTIPCHRIILAGRSAVFAGMFESNMIEVQDGTLLMVDMSAEGVEGFLKYVYTGSLVDATANLSIAFEMLRAGHKYKIDDLEFACKKILDSATSNSFDAVTAFEMYQYCVNVDGLAALQTKALRILKVNAQKFKETGEIVALLESTQSADDRKALTDWICCGLQYA